MIPELGLFALILALAVAAAQAWLGLVGAGRDKPAWMAAAGPAALAQFGLIAVAFAALTQAYLVSDFTVANVAFNSHSAKPLLYKITGVWGNHEGSMLLWLLILALCGAAVAAFGGRLPDGLRARVLGVQGLIGLAFLAFTILTSNPFERLWPAPLDGRDLNPLLQDPGLAFHPPLLYTGYVGFSVTFSFAVAALIEGRVDPAWARWVRPWTLFAWIFLTAGIALGSWWAYYELGWGGWWFWDPVENVSLLPWLIGTALLHSAIVLEKREALKVWTVLLAIVAFSMSLIGTFIVRSGLLTSVHSFASDPTRGVFILVLLALVIGGSLALFAWRAGNLRAVGGFRPVSREGGLLLNNLLLVTAAATVFLGTLYPLFLEAATGARVTVGPPYYLATFAPLMAPLVAVMALGPYLAWKRADLGAVLGRLKWAGLASLAVAGAVWIAHNDGPPLAVLGVLLGAWLLCATLSEWAERVRLFRVPLGESWARARGLPAPAYGMTLAHAGLAVAVIGMVGASAWKQERIEAAMPGDSFEIAGYEITYRGVEVVPGPNYEAERGWLEVRRDGREIAVMAPERRFYPVQEMVTTEAAIRTTGLGDLYVVIGEPGEAGLRTLRLYYEPLVPWIWAGAGLMALGGLVSLAGRRASLRARRTAPAAPAAA